MKNALYDQIKLSLEGIKLLCPEGHNTTEFKRIEHYCDETLLICYCHTCKQEFGWG